MADISAVLKRLEAATARLEDMILGGNNTGVLSPAQPAAPPQAPPAADAPLPEAVAEFDALVASHLALVLTKASAVGGVVQEQGIALSSAFAAQRAFLLLATRAKKPSAADLPTFLKPIQAGIEAVIKVRESARASPLFNHLSVVSEGVLALGWVAVEPAPAPFVGEMKDSATFFANKVIREYKDKDQVHVEFARAFLVLLAELQIYVKKYHTTGVAWNPRGGDAKDLESSVSATPTATTAAPAPKPAPAPAAANLFSALNKEGLTSGLRKVDKSEMTHKNPDLRASSVVSATEKPATATVKSSVVAPVVKAPPKCALEGNKWIVENYLNASEPVVIKNPELRHTVYIYNCINSTISVEGKVNAVTLGKGWVHNCKKSGLLLSSIVSTVDIVNCKSVQVQVTQYAPTIAIDKTDGCQVYLSAGSVETGVEVLTAMSSEVNVLVEGDGEDGGYKERPVPEQIKSIVKKGGMTTEIVEHKG
ncbi:hypothetical protein HDU84_003388 [Entophlyctis sp. JEL0112]|nr:hypothetical protein HDU84_003388 [Entophlyctis sp. JEL0112]